MKHNKPSKTVAFTAVFFSLAMPAIQAQQLSDTEWNAGDDGNWSDLTWSAGVPTSGSLAGILTADMVTVGANTVTDLEQILLDGFATLEVNALIGVEGSDKIDVADPDPDIPATGLFVNSGILSVNSGGELSVTTGGDLVIGNAGVGELNLEEGASIITDRPFILGTGGGAVATLTQTGGSLDHTGEYFRLGAAGGAAEYDLSGGTLEVNTLRLAFGSSAAAVMNQSGGDITASGETTLGWDGGEGGNSSWNLSGGSLTTSKRIRIGVGGNGPRTHIFDQTGGDVTVEGGGDGRIDIGENEVNTSIYQMSDGILTTEGRILVGAHGTGTGALNLSGVAAGTMFGVFVGNNPTNIGTMSLSDEAMFEIGELEIRNGSLTQSGEDSHLTVTSRLWVGASQSVDHPASYTITGGNLELFGNQVIVGNGNAADATFNIEGGIIDSSTRLRVGNGKADGSLTATNLVNQTGGTVTVQNRVDIGENPGPTNIYQISGGSLTSTGNILVGFFNDGSGVLTIGGDAEVDAPNVVMGESAGGDPDIRLSKGTVNLNGGILTTSNVKVGNGPTADQTLNLNGGTIRAKSDGADLISGNVTTASLQGGGITFDSNDFAVTTTAVMTGPGGLTKTGGGTLTVNSVQAYTGDTSVEQGTLVLSEPYLDDASNLHLSSGATLELAHEGTDTIGALFLDGAPVVIGEWGPLDSGAVNETEQLTGSGLLNVTSEGAIVELEIVSIVRTGSLATLVIKGAPSSDYICQTSLDLEDFSPIATDPATVTTDGNGDATFTVDATELTKFYVVTDSL